MTNSKVNDTCADAEQRKIPGVGLRVLVIEESAVDEDGNRRFLRITSMPRCRSCLPDDPVSVVSTQILE